MDLKKATQILRDYIGEEETSLTFNEWQTQIFIAIDKVLETLEELHERLGKQTPCKVGDIVYEANVQRGIISSYKITSIVIMSESRNYNWELIDGIYSNINGFNEFALNKTIFLKQKEAEALLNQFKVL